MQEEGSGPRGLWCPRLRVLPRPQEPGWREQLHTSRGWTKVCKCVI